MSDLPKTSQQIIKNIFDEKIEEKPIYHDKFELYFAVCRAVITDLKLQIIKPSLDFTKQQSIEDYLQIIADVNLLRLRKVHLQENWWVHDYGPLIVFYEGEMCAAIQTKKSEYVLINFKDGSKKKISLEVAKKIDSSAYLFYKTFKNKTVSIKEVLSFTFSGLKSDIIKATVYQLLMSVLLLTIPFFTAIIFDEVVSQSNLSLFAEYASLFIVTVISITLIQLLEIITMLRIRIKSQYQIQIGIWDRLMRLPLSFFRNFSVGDLAFRTGISRIIQERLSANVLKSISNGLMSILYFFIMFYIDSFIALLTVIVVATLFVVNFLINIMILKKESLRVKTQSSMFGRLLSVINSIIKIRIANKEKEAFEFWLEDVAENIYAKNRLNALNIHLDLVNIGFFGISTLIIYSLVVWRGQLMSFSDFIIFNAAFVALFSALTSYSKAVSEAINVIPLFNLIKPLFDTEIEEDSRHKGITILNGEIVLQDIVFRYPMSEKPLFVDLNLTIKPGSFTALVGVSGSGKSTILRLLLGLEKPESGDIKFGGISINNLQLSNIRSQIGTVMQFTQLFPGTIFENLAGKNYQLTREQAWILADKVGLKTMIHDLPMGMDTLLMEGMETFSTGEIQRLNLARALSINPELILLDEATSALDNTVQKQIQNFLEELKATRIVVAHRLSTIKDADIIHVIDEGKVVESGKFATLMANKSHFYKLVMLQSMASDA